MTLMFIGKRLFALLVCTLVVCCSSLSQNEVDSRALAKIMDYPEFVMYLHPDVKGRLPIVMVSNGAFSSDLKLSKFGHDIIIIDKGDSESNVVFEKYERQGSNIIFEIKYDIEGVFYKGVLRVDAGNVSIISKEVGEL